MESVLSVFDFVSHCWTIEELHVEVSLDDDNELERRDSRNSFTTSVLFRNFKCIVLEIGWFR